MWLLLSFRYLICFFIVEICMLKGESRNHLENTKRVLKSKDLMCQKKFKQILDLSLDKPLIEKVRSADFQLLLVEEPRNYSAIVLFNTHKIYCGAECDMATKNLQLVSNFYKIMKTRTGTPPQVFFLEILEESRSDILRMVGIGHANLPTLFYFPTHGKLQNLKEMDLKKYSLGNLENILEWIFNVSNIVIDIDRKHDPDILEPNLFMRLISTLLFVIHFIKYRHLIFYLLIEKTANCLGVMAIFMVCFCSSGQLFNGIRYTPFVGESSSGYHFIHPSTMSQFGGESFFIMLLYFGITAATIGLIEGRREILRKNNSNSGFLILTTSLLALFFFFTLLHHMYLGKLWTER